MMPFVDNKMRMNVRLALLLVVSGLAIQCNNYDLLEKLQNPGPTSSTEKFTSNYYVFVSSWSTLGAMGGSPYNAECGSSTGAAKADCACTRAAISRGLRRSSTHVFRAWLSTSTSEARCRVIGQGNGCATNFPGIWFNTIGETIASNYNGFEGGTLTNAIRYDEFGSDQGVNDVWTGSEVGGTAVITPAPAQCTDWSLMSGPTGRIGNRLMNTSLWINNGNNGCENSYRVYCIASPIF